MNKRVLIASLGPMLLLSVLVAFTPLGGASVSNLKTATGQTRHATAAKTPRGRRGPRGARGPRGLRGLQGQPGTTGARGPGGATGARGLQGPKGDKGSQGAPGGLAVYCVLAKANPLSYSDAPCRARGETVDSSNLVGTYTSLTVGTDRNPVLSYYDNENAELKVTHCNDPACVGGDETVSTLNTAGDGGLHTSIAIGSDGNPVISYYTGGDLKVARCNDPACSGSDEALNLVDSAGDAGRFSSIAIGTDGNPVISYYDGHLKVAHCNDPACAGNDETVTTVDSGGNVGLWTSIAIGTDGNPIISYEDSTNGKLRVAHCNDPACADLDELLTIVDNAGALGGYTSMAIGTDGMPVISYFDPNLDTGVGNIRVAHCNDIACAGSNETMSTITDAGINGGYTSIAIANDGNPVVSYYDYTSGDLKLARCNDPACAGSDEALSTVDGANANVGKYSSIALGVDGNPVIGYLDSGLHHVKVAHPALR